MPEFGSGFDAPKLEPKAQPKKEAMYVLRQGITDITSYFREEEGMGKQLLADIEKKLPDEIDKKGLVDLLEEMRLSAIKEGSPTAHMLLNLRATIQRSRF